MEWGMDDGGAFRVDGIGPVTSEVLSVSVVSRQVSSNQFPNSDGMPHRVIAVCASERPADMGMRAGLGGMA
jgi:hypothetical protein